MEMNNESEEHHHAEGNDEHAHDKDASMKTREITASSKKNAATSAIIDGYLQIKNGLVADNKDNAAKGGTALLAAFSNFDMTKLDEAQHKEHMEIVESAKEQAEHIAKSPIDHQREHFVLLSKDVSDLIATFGTNQKLYLDFCPMADNNKGAVWISETKEITNPYFGKDMATCGSIKKE